MEQEAKTKAEIHILVNSREVKREHLTEYHGDRKHVIKYDAETHGSTFNHHHPGSEPVVLLLEAISAHMHTELDALEAEKPDESKMVTLCNNIATMAVFAHKVTELLLDLANGPPTNPLVHTSLRCLEEMALKSRQKQAEMEAAAKAQAEMEAAAKATETLNDIIRKGRRQ